MKYYNQNDYSHVPYPSPSLPNATVKSGGCGVCCSATIASHFGFDNNITNLAKTFIEQKIRVDGGTDMRLAATWLCEKYNLKCTQTSDTATLTRHLAAGDAAIANVGGNRANYTGVFSTGGHYICVLGLSGSDYKIFDVGDYSTKYNSTYRKSKVKRSGIFLLCTPQVLAADTQNRTPSYYIFTKSKDLGVEETIKNLSKDQAAEIIRGKTRFADVTMQYIFQSYKWGDDLVIKLAAPMLRANKSTAAALTPAQAKTILAQKAGLSENTIAYLADYYRYGQELVTKLAGFM